MAKPTKLPSGKWFIQIKLQGVRKSGTFTTAAEAKAWQVQECAEILRGVKGEIPDKNFGQLLSRYSEEVSPIKKGARWEQIRIRLILRDEIAKVKLDKLNETHVAAWRDRRLKSVTGASVRREWTLLSHAANVAIKEWKWLKHNPFSDVRRPEKPEDRDRLFLCHETDAILAALGFDDGIPPNTVSQRVAYAMLWALETGMRAGEICALMPDDVAETVAVIKTGKSRAAKRRVPLMPYAREIAAIMKANPSESGTLFGVSTSQIDSLFRKARDRCGIKDLHFHDTRHVAVTRLARLTDILSLARAIGHSDLKKLQLYFNRSAEDIADDFAQKFPSSSSSIMSSIS
jgi:integrase